MTKQSEFAVLLGLNPLFSGLGADSINKIAALCHTQNLAAGEILFYKDEKAEDMLYIVSGRFKLVESGIVLPVGAIVGELGMLSPSNVRTQTLECIEGGMILSVSYAQVEELYVQNPAFGFYFLRLASARLFQNLDTLEKRLAQQTAAAANPLAGARNHRATTAAFWAGSAWIV